MASVHSKHSTLLRSFISHYGDSSAPEIEKTPANRQPFSRLNFILIGICMLLIVAGFLLMAGPGSSVEEGFNPDIFSTRRIVVGPAISFIGFLAMAFAIVWQPSRRTDAEAESKESDEPLTEKED